MTKNKQFKNGSIDPINGSENLICLYRSFLKGVAYFKDRFATGRATPVIRRELAEFEREIVGPFNEAWLKLTAREREILEESL